MSAPRVLLIVALSALLLGLVGWGSRVRYHTAAGEEAVLRLSWRTRPERKENCRDRTPQELAALPVHMRTPRVCEKARAVPYRLVLAIDGGPADTTILSPAGARHDRPIYVLRDSVLPPGLHHVSVLFARADDDGAGPVQFNGDLKLAAGYIELITMADDAPQLVHRSAQ